LPGKCFIFLSTAPGFPLSAVVFSTISRPGIEQVDHILKLIRQLGQRSQQDTLQWRNRLPVTIVRPLFHYLRARPIVHYPFHSQGAIEVRTKARSKEPVTEEPA